MAVIRRRCRSILGNGAAMSLDMTLKAFYALIVKFSTTLGRSDISKVSRRS